MNQEIKKTYTIPEKVEAYRKSVKQVEDILKSLTEVDIRLREVFDFSVSRLLVREVTNLSVWIRRMAWTTTFRTIGIENYVSRRRYEKIMLAIDTGELEEAIPKSKTKPGEDIDYLPMYSEENIIEIFQALQQCSSSLLQEQVEEVSKWLRTGARFSAKHKTNLKNARFEIGKKIIIEHAAERPTDSYYRISRYSENYFAGLDRIFHVLDGKQMKDYYISPVVDGFNQSEFGEYESEYFSLKAHYNKNIHLEFKRLDRI